MLLSSVTAGWKHYLCHSSACFDEIDSTQQLYCARWAGFGLSVCQPIKLGPGMTSIHGLSESKERSCSYAKINDGNRENWRENCLIR